MFNSRLRLAVLALAMVGAATPVFAGPPLICHPFETKGGTLLPWAAPSSVNQWNAPLGSYKVDNLTADVIKLLDTDTPVITRMEKHAPGHDLRLEGPGGCPAAAGRRRGAGAVGANQRGAGVVSTPAT
jgi:hypothetical protein